MGDVRVHVHVHALLTIVIYMHAFPFHTYRAMLRLAKRMRIQSDPGNLVS